MPEASKRIFTKNQKWVIIFISACLCQEMYSCSEGYVRQSARKIEIENAKEQVRK